MITDREYLEMKRTAEREAGAVAHAVMATLQPRMLEASRRRQGRLLDDKHSMEDEYAAAVDVIWGFYMEL